ncbi:MAG: DUF5118 domain-containing protein, partial [Gemmatimonadota bacterium]
MTSTRPTLIALAFAVLACHPAAKPAAAPAPATTPTAQRPAGAPTPSTDSTRSRPGGGPGAGAEPTPQSYAKVITSEAKTKSGLFKAHRVGAKLYFEIPRSELDRDQLLVTEIAKTTAGVGYGGQSLGDDVIRWERRDNRILLRFQDYSIISSDSTNPISSAVRNANYAPIIKAKYGGRVYIEVR